MIARVQPHALLREHRQDLPALLPGVLLAALMVLWTIQDGGYDPSTWYWGALLLLAAVPVALIYFGGRRPLSGPVRLALLAFALYVAWSYLSIAWASYPGDALQGSNRALLYLLVFTLVAMLPWTPAAGLATMLTLVLGVGAVALVLLARLASGHGTQSLFEAGRLLGPTGYLNASAALFTIIAVMAIALAAPRRLPSVLRGILIAVAAAGLQLAVIVQSRGWLFTLPLVVIMCFACVRHRLRVAVAAAVTVAAVLVPLHRLLAVYRGHLHPASLPAAAGKAGHAALIAVGVALLCAVVLAWIDELAGPVAVGRRRQRALGVVAAAVFVLGGVIGALRVSHGHPVSFVKRQWNGFIHPRVATGTTSYFTAAGTGRYDFWRVSLHAFATHPLGGLGQDNFADYYIRRRRTTEEPQWTHSLEMRLLAHTGIVGALLFAAFVVAALAAAVRARRHSAPDAAWVAGAAMLPAVVWLIHGSVDWFWEMPALSGPALGLLALAGGLGSPGERGVGPAPTGGRRIARRAAAGAAVAAFVAAVVALGLPYLAVREVSAANAVSANQPGRALQRLGTAADLNPLSAEPGRIGGALALQSGRFELAEQRFRQATDREPGGWFSWLGAGLAASRLGEPEQAQRDFAVAASINSQQPAVVAALRRVLTPHPLTVAQAFQLLVLAQ